MRKKTAPKTNKKKIWFKAKKFGWGWYPITWQGWVILFSYFVLIAINILRVQALAIPEEEILRFVLPETIAMTIILILICWLKGEKPKWRWGNEKK